MTSAPAAPVGDKLLRPYGNAVKAGLVLALFGLLLLILYALQTPNILETAMVALLVALSSLTVMFLAGFVFAIPRAAQQATNPATGYSVNTNLEQISDWLTKIIVGIGLVELTRISGGFARLATLLGPGFGGEPASVLVAGVDIVFFGAFGFLAGYLLTRTYFSAAFEDFTNAAVTAKVTPSLAQSSADLARLVDPGSLAADVDRAGPGSGAKVSPTQNREPADAGDAPPVAEVHTIDRLRSEIDSLLAALLRPRARGSLTTADMITLLEHRGILDPSAGRSLHDFVAAVETARTAAGNAADVDLPPDLEHRAKAVLTQLSELCTRAPARFEEHVLSTLVSAAAPDWTVRSDVAVRREVLDLDRTGDAEVSARVDAVVSRYDRQVVVEVRPRLDAAVPGQVDAVNAWLAALPAEVPVVLVVVTDSLRAQSLRAPRGNPVQVLHWDREHEALGATVARNLWVDGDTGQ